MIDVRICPDAAALGLASAELGAAALRDVLAEHGEACIVVATGASQFAMLEALTAAPGIDWRRVTAFHLDEYVGLPDSHPASFRGYLRQRFLAPLRDAPVFHPVVGDAADPATEAQRLSALLRGRRVDLCFAGIGENCHLAFNDPPADFETEEPFILVTLDEACRRQQLGEGWFPTLQAVPRQAISMSVRQILRAGKIILTTPDRRKAAAVRDALEGPVTPLHPASILQNHADTTIFLDPDSASLLTRTAGA
ncbi:glucosamine-6-phosphate deaminase [Pseudoroseomonas deserti]|uniref:Glucosamine-6-phosphate deaminase n=1 Tax=Teichococcus deserti TaxID=1817963 RepID=A0A1V2H919_9PROT|nr:glucosamine-6-phosphate deaminase [Pseudoroseomonas deserti]ONG59119.1 glucosamine-6-phosphate deaminase [Pseudoroseomonas deserti]